MFCDESAQKGVRYSNFFGGLLIKARDEYRLRSVFDSIKGHFNPTGEVKWQKTSAYSLPLYKSIVETLFDEVYADNIKIRIMFTQNLRAFTGEKVSRNIKYFKLYYQLIKNAFGFNERINSGEKNKISLRIHLDKIPHKSGKEDFKNYLMSLNTQKAFKNGNVSIIPNGISEIDSKDHILLQCLDLVLGSIHFRLNRLHKEIPKGKNRRGKKTIAKEELYKHIYKNICKGMPGYQFNIGENTNYNFGNGTRWEMPYKHWHFKPKDSKLPHQK